MGRVYHPPQGMTITKSEFLRMMSQWLENVPETARITIHRTIIRADRPGESDEIDVSFHADWIAEPE